jgi:uncharacterized protein YkwD
MPLDGCGAPERARSLRRVTWALKPTSEMPTVPRHRRRRGLHITGAVATALAVVAGAVGAVAVFNRGPLAADSAAGALAGSLPAGVTPIGSTPTTHPTRTPSPSASKHGGSSLAAMESQVIALTNAQRAAHRCQPLRLDTRLRTAARAHSLEMARVSKLRHDSQDGQDPGERMSAAGYDSSGGWAENIARGYATAQAVMAAWLDSERHRANVLNCDLRAVGVGVARASNGQLYWTQDFGTH